MMRIRALAGGLYVALCAAFPGMAQDSGPPLAGDYIMFQSPTGNIHCGIFDFPGDRFARCDLMELTPSYPTPPADCWMESAFSFSVGRTGAGYITCATDGLRSPDNPVLPYGNAVSLGGMSCVSAKTGMTCTNAEGHGFAVAKAKQKLF